MRTVKIKVYTFPELTDKAKEKARIGWIESEFDQSEFDYILGEAEDIGLKITNSDIDHPSRAEGYFLWSAPESAEAIVKEHGKDCATHKLAAAYLHNLPDTPIIDESDEHYSAEEYDLYDAQKEKLDRMFCIDLLQEYMIILKKEEEYKLSDECIDQLLTENEYEYMIDGKLFHESV